MKPVMTWIVLASSRTVRVITHSGTGKGLDLLNTMTFEAPTVVPRRDRAGVGHSIGGPGIAAVDQTDPQDLADAQFAKSICEDLHYQQAKGAFDRLVIAAGPHMLGLIRRFLSDELKALLLGEIPKDLSAQPLRRIEAHLADILAV